jgi:hypothetical protein
MTSEERFANMLLCNCELTDVLVSWAPAGGGIGIEKEGNLLKILIISRVFYNKLYICPEYSKATSRSCLAVSMTVKRLPPIGMEEHKKNF